MCSLHNDPEVALHGKCRSLAEQLDPKALSTWFQNITGMRTEVVTWVQRHSKHGPAGYPLCTTLLCLEPDPPFFKHVDTFMEVLHRQLKVQHRGSEVLRGLS